MDKDIANLVLERANTNNPIISSKAFTRAKLVKARGFESMPSKSNEVNESINQLLEDGIIEKVENSSYKIIKDIYEIRNYFINVFSFNKSIDVSLPLARFNIEDILEDTWEGELKKKSGNSKTNESDLENEFNENSLESEISAFYEELIKNQKNNKKSGDNKEINSSNNEPTEKEDFIEEDLPSQNKIKIDNKSEKNIDDKDDEVFEDDEEKNIFNAITQLFIDEIDGDTAKAVALKACVNAQKPTCAAIEEALQIEKSDARLLLFKLDMEGLIDYDFDDENNSRFLFSKNLYNKCCKVFEKRLDRFKSLESILLEKCDTSQNKMMASNGIDFMLVSCAFEFKENFYDILYEIIIKNKSLDDAKNLAINLLNNTHVMKETMEARMYESIIHKLNQLTNNKFSEIKRQLIDIDKNN